VSFDIYNINLDAYRILGLGDNHNENGGMSIIRNSIEFRMERVKARFGNYE